MSAKQILKAEGLLEMVASPRPQPERYEQPITDKELVEHSSFNVSSDNSVSIASHQRDTQTLSTGLDTIACHAFVAETKTESDESVFDNIASLSKSVTEYGVSDSSIADRVNVADSEKEKNINPDLVLDMNKDSFEVDTDLKLEQLGKKQENDSEMDIQFSECDAGLVIRNQKEKCHSESIGHSPAKSEEQVISETFDFASETKVHQKLGQCKVPDAVEKLEVDSSTHKTGMYLNHSFSGQNQMNEEMVTPEPGYEELRQELRACKEELLSTKSQLSRAERKLEKANVYNEDLRKQVESLSAEIHKYRHRTVKEVAIEVDKDELMNYAAGHMVLPDWGITVQSSSKTLEDENQATGDKLSIAESLKATAEAVVLQQSGFVYDETSGLYYDYKSGYYYDNEKSLYYEPNTGTYFYYNHETNEYQFHSQVDVSCYQWQYQPGAPNSQHTETDGTAQKNENCSDQDHISKRNEILSKEKLKKAERKRKKEKKDKDKDNKVVSEEVEEILSSFEDMKITVRNHALELAGGWPPCIRVIVTDSNCLEVGTLFIVTCTGGTLGREKDMNHAIRIPDINVSKMHAEIKFDSQRGQYEILDRGSQNGTFVNDHRIAEAKEQSSATPITHGNVIQLADTKLLCHIHAGSDTCDSCEPGIVIANHLAKQPQKRITILSKEEKKKEHKKQLQEIKKKYGLKNAAYVDNIGAITNPLYTDKASERRKTVGSETPNTLVQGTPASVHRPISSGNIGHKLLKKMGWSEGESLGKGNTGIQEPVSVTLRANQTAGLGSSAAGIFSPDDANSIDVKKAARRVQAQQRFNQLPTEATGNQPDKPQTNKQWTKGATQFLDGGIG